MTQEFGKAGFPIADKVLTVQGVVGGIPIGTGSGGGSAPTTAATTSAVVNASAAGANVLVAAVAGQTIRIHRLMISFASAVDAKFTNGATDLTGLFHFQSGGSIVLDYGTEPWFVTTAGNSFGMNLSAAVAATGVIYYTQSAP